MAKSKNEAWENFIKKWEQLSDNFVKIFYNDSLLKKIESLDFMKNLINSSFIKEIQNFWKGWFKQVFIFFWYLAIIFWIISIIMNIFSLFNSLIYIRWVLLIILWIGMSLLSVITWFWMVKFKSWYPFIVVITFFYQIIYYILQNLYGNIYYYSISSLIWYIVISLLFFVVWLSLVLKNKDLFDK
jgi:hypothetical protein